MREISQLVYKNLNVCLKIQKLGQKLKITLCGYLRIIYDTYAHMYISGGHEKM